VLDLPGEFAKCEEVGLSESEGAAKFITRVTSRDLHLAKYFDYFWNAEKSRPTASLRVGFSDFVLDVGQGLDINGGIAGITRLPEVSLVA
jgi:hypothetical protein